VITRYSRPEMRAIWTDEDKLKIWLQIELLTSEVDWKRHSILNGQGDPCSFDRTNVSMGCALAGRGDLASSTGL
jgi:hypothetical protein